MLFCAHSNDKDFIAIMTGRVINRGGDSNGLDGRQGDAELRYVPLERQAEVDRNQARSTQLQSPVSASPATQVNLK